MTEPGFPSPRRSKSVLPPFWWLVEEHAAELLRYARRLTGDEAEDVLQEALLRALRSYPRVEDGRHLRAWLYRIVTTTAFDHSAKLEAGPLPADVLPESGVVDRLPDDGFEDLIRGLPEGARKAMVLRFVDDLPYEDIAERLQCTSQAARRRVATSIKTLRGRI